MGISFDEPEKNKQWRDRMGMTFDLLSDPDKTVAGILGARRPDDHPGARWARRISYLVDPDGVIQRSYNVGREFLPHPGEVLADLGAIVGGDAA